MATGRATELEVSELQLALMRVIWARGAATTAEIHAAVGTRRALAYTTVATLLRRLEARGLLEHERRGRQFVYRATVTEARVRKSMVSGLLDTLFQGDPAALVSHLVGAGEVSEAELRALSAALEEREDDDD